MTLHTNERLQHLVAAIIITAIMLALFHPLATVAGFAPRDDISALLVLADAQPHPQFDVYDLWDGDVFKATQSDLALHGRFRPVWWAMLYLEAGILGYNAALWQLETIVIGIATVFLLYYSARKLTLSFVPALWCGIWLIFVGSGLWQEKLIGEEQGLLFLMLALLAFTQSARKQDTPTRGDWAGLLLLVLAGLSKESFVLVIPAMIGFRLAARWFFMNYDAISTKQSAPTLWAVLYKMRGFVISAALITLLALVPVYIAYSQGQHAQQAAGTLTITRFFDVQNALEILAIMGNGNLYFLPIFAALAGLVYLRKRENFILAGLIIGLMLIYVAPQNFLYPAENFYGKYFFPAGIAIIFLSGLGMEWLYRLMPRIIFAGGFGLLLLLISYQSVTATWYRVQTQVARVNTLERTIAITHDAMQQSDGAILVVTDVYFEREDVLMVELGRRGTTAALYFDVVPNASGELNGERFMPYEQARPDDIDVIVSFLPPDDFLRYAEERYPWFTMEAWQLEAASWRFELLSWRNLLGLSAVDTERNTQRAVFIRSAAG